MWSLVSPSTVWRPTARLWPGRRGGYMNGWVLPEGLLRDAPSYAPRPRELADLELLLSGGLTPLTGFHTSADIDAIARRSRLADGTPWPGKVTLEVPATSGDLLHITNP